MEGNNSSLNKAGKFLKSEDFDRKQAANIKQSEEEEQKLKEMWLSLYRKCLDAAICTKHLKYDRDMVKSWLKDDWKFRSTINTIDLNWRVSHGQSIAGQFFGSYIKYGQNDEVILSSISHDWRMQSLKTSLENDFYQKLGKEIDRYRDEYKFQWQLKKETPDISIEEYPLIASMTSERLEEYLNDKASNPDPRESRTSDTETAQKHESSDKAE